MENNTILNFIIMKEGFILDYANTDTLSDLQKKFKNNNYEALYHWGFQEHKDTLHPSALFLNQVFDIFMKSLISMSELEVARGECKVNLTDEIWLNIQAKIPFILGNEFIDKDWIQGIFNQFNTIFAKEIEQFDGSVKLYFAEKNQDLRTPERVFFHLVENKNGDEPFAFLATYATKTVEGKVKHLPLKYALEEFKQDRDKLLTLLSCLNKAAEVSSLISQLVESGELFHPLMLTAHEAYDFLKHVEKIETCGILCRIPNWWRKKYSSISMNIKMGDTKPSLLGFNSLLSQQPVLVVDGVELTKTEIKDLLKQTEGLAFLKGKWVEVNHDKLRELLEKIDKNNGEITLMDALRNNLEVDKDADNGIFITNGEWLSNLLQNLRNPANLKSSKVPKTMNVTLRPYQSLGYSWLDYMNTLGFGACLADDMGLGKTVQVLAFLEHMREQNLNYNCLLIVPASLLENWRREAEKFAPNMDIHILHGHSVKQLSEELQTPSFLTITTYGMVSRIHELKEKNWQCIILDEAQAIKNPLTKQTKEIKKLQGNMKLAMTGTPIENEITNLWSLFDFLNKGLLGTASEFKQFSSKLDAHPELYGKLKTMISPFILRRLKTDKSIITDLPEKIETVDYVDLSKQQVILYRKILADMEEKLENSKGIERRGLVLATITKLKQICNHPDQYLGSQGYAMKESGKFKLLKELCETIHEKRERVLIFSQYKEIIPFLSNFLEDIFQHKGLIIHGGVPVKKRGEIVKQFNDDAYVPFVICSLKAAGTGLNLTAANHVIHFDRWWNPAVENQATDRAFRIGQKKNVMVHKFVCEGSIEEKIDSLINSKKELAESVISTGTSSWITELNNEDLLNLLRLDK